MADQDVMKEFLVSLGFKVDKTGMKSFTDGVDGATKTVKNLVTAITGASLAVAAGVSAFASNLEGLYFAAQRVGASATSIKSAEYAARDLGASAAEARGSLESMARFLRDNPGGESFLKGIGVQTRDANGNLRDTADLMVDLGNRLRSMPWYQAKQYAGILGIDDNTLRAIISGDFGRKLEENRKHLAGSGLDQATKDAHAFMEALRGILIQFEGFTVRVQASLMKTLGPELQRFSEWFEKNSPMIADRLAEIVAKLLDLAEQAGPYLQQIWKFFVDLDTATDGWSTRLLVLIGLLNTIGALGVVAGISNLAAAFLRLGSAIGGAGAAASGAGAVALGTLATGLGAALYSSSLNEGEDDLVHQRKLAEDRASGEIPGGTDMAYRIIQFFTGLGWTEDQAVGITANLSAESGFNPTAVGDGGKAYGVAQWHPDRQANFKQWSGKDIRQATLEDQLGFVHYELTQGAEVAAGKLLRAADNARDAGAVVSRYYERPAKADAEAAARGSAAAQLSQSNTINVYGATDPNATASAVGGAQKQVNQDLVRNLSNPVN
ncbi:phage tail tip lysozyme [Pseudomonas sichuanensis]|uniref:phage tail tip lysozyme n=1 Tax=Pseudomonas sichuanensis TaxID=2213015 RepID=UPI000DA65B8D|nr:phage tail tip lysozyme [Pseudomonas sichuanensis]